MHRGQSLFPFAAAIVTSLALVAGCSSVPSAPSAPSAQTLGELAPGGRLRIAVLTSNPVIGSKDKTSGELKGPTVSLGRALAEQAAVAVTLIEYTNVAKLVDEAKTGAWDIAVLAFDPGRRSLLEFAPPHITVDLTYLVAPGAAISSVAGADAPGVKIAAAKGAATTLFLERNLKQATVTPADNEPAAFALLKDGKAQAYAQNRTMLLGLADTLPGSRVLDDRFASAEMCMVLPKGRMAALAYVSGFVAAAKANGQVAAAIQSAGLRGVMVAERSQ
jgi:polar amino acid transport system substrate-binding protein